MNKCYASFRYNPILIPFVQSVKSPATYQQLIHSKILIKFCLSGLLLLASFAGKTQSLTPQVLGSAGSTIISRDMNLSWTLGETAVSMWNANAGNGALTEGFHQPRLQTSPLSKSEVQWVQIMPNPVRETLNVIPVYTKEKYLGNLQDAQGRVLRKDIRLNGATEIDMQEYPSGVYFLSIRASGNSAIQNHKIIKL